jgi:hypothetical protein
LQQLRVGPAVPAVIDSTAGRSWAASGAGNPDRPDALSLAKKAFEDCAPFRVGGVSTPSEDNEGSAVGVDRIKALRASMDTDLDLPLGQLLQSFLWRWEIELNFRNEKTVLGVGKSLGREFKPLCQQYGGQDERR